MSIENKNHDAGFTLPENYLETLTERVMENVQQPARTSSKTAGFEVPEDYLEQLTDRVMNRVNSIDVEVAVEGTRFRESENATKPSHNNTALNHENNHSMARVIKMYAAPLIGVAAAIVALFTLNGVGEEPAIDFSDLSDETITEYVMNMEDHMDEDAVEILFAEEQTFVDVTTTLDVTDEELLDFLIDDVDINQIFTE